jgi:hypothetical protein
MNDRSFISSGHVRSLLFTVDHIIEDRKNAVKRKRNLRLTNVYLTTTASYNIITNADKQ